MRADAATLRLAVFPRVGLAADAVLVLAGTGLVAALYLAAALLPTAWRLVERVRRP